MEEFVALGIVIFIVIFLVGKLFKLFYQIGNFLSKNKQK
jgi:hypothetical protein